MNEQMVWVIGLLAVIFLGGLAAASFFKIRKIQRTPTYWIGSLPESGRAGVGGMVKAMAIQSPLQNIPCALWQLEVEEEHRGKNGTSWTTVLNEVSTEPFELSDETGSVLVHPSLADTTLSLDVCDDTLSPKVIEHMTQKAIQMRTFFGTDKKFRAKERTVVAGEPVYVLGEVKLRNGVKTLESSADFQMLIGDRSQETIVSELRSRMLLYLGGVLAAVIIVGVMQLVG